MSAASAGLATLRRSNSASRLIALAGVRMSWLTAARKRVFWTLASSASQRRPSNSRCKFLLRRDVDERRHRTRAAAIAVGDGRSVGQEHHPLARGQEHFDLLPARLFAASGRVEFDALPSARRDHQEHPPPQTGGKSADTVVTTMVVGRNDKSGTSHLISDSQQMKNASFGDTTNYFYHVGTATNAYPSPLFERRNHGGVAGGFVIVEYY